MRSARWLRGLARVALAAMAVVCLGASASAKPVAPEERKDRMEPLPDRLVGVDVEERLENIVPKERGFVNQDGKAVRLGDYIRGDLPIVVTLNYSSCPMLCSLQLNGLVESLKKVDWTIGKDYRVLTIVLDPNEKPARSKETRDRYVAEYGRPEAAEGWHFLTGSKENVKAVADSIGFRYGYNEVRDEYVHPAALAMLTPDGTIARYLYGIEFHPKTVRLSLIEVAEGKIGSPFDKLILYCFHYDEKEGRYAPVAMNIMRVSGGVSVIVLGGFLTSFWLAESRRRKNRQPETPRSSES